MRCEGLAFRMCCISKIFKARTFLFLQFIEIKIIGVTIILMINLGESEKVTAVLKVFLFVVF
jgi:hypothetical protein